MVDLDLSDFFKTTVEAHDFITRLSIISGDVYKTDFNLDKALTDQFGVQKKDKFNILLRDNKISLTPSALDKFFIKIQEKVTALPIVSLVLAFEPNEETLEAIFDWFPININTEVLLDVKVNQAIIAGALISYKGKTLDYSIKPIYDQLINQPQKNTQPTTVTKN